MSKPHAMIVGAGPGIGIGASRAFGKAGFSVSLLSRSPHNVRDDALSLVQAGVSAECFTADAGLSESLVAAITNASQRFGPPEVLIYNAVAFRMAKPTQLKPADLKADLNVNLIGALVASQTVLPSMLSRKSGGLFFTGGGWAHYPSAHVASTAIGKATIRHLAIMLHEELKGTGVKVSTITVMGQVSKGSAFDPEKIGQSFLNAYQQPAELVPAEIQFKGA